MRIKNKLFPYPILNRETHRSNFLNRKFNLIFDDMSDEKFFCLKNVGFETDSITIRKLICEDKVNVAVVLESPATIFRKTYNITNKRIEIVVPYERLSGKVIISMFAYATTNFLYQPMEIEDDYSNIIFEIEKYDILAADDGFSLSVFHSDAEESLVKSIFSITSNENIEDDIYEVEYKNYPKIRISMSETNYVAYNRVYSKPFYKEVFFNIMLVPTLTQALSECINDIRTGEVDDIDSLVVIYPWFSSIVAGYERLYGEILTEEVLMQTQPIIVAQSLLGKPLNQSLNTLINILETDIYEEEE